MAGSTPSLSEILSITRDPGEGTVAPKAKFDTQQLVSTVNQAAQFKAENDWRKYSQFMGQLKDTYKELGEIQGLAVAEADRPALQKKAADIFAEIGNDPKGFFGGKLADVEKKIGELKSLSTQSMQDKIFDDAHRAYMEKDPTLQTDENKSILEGYFKQPLGQRKPYMLKLPSLYDPKAISDQINAVIPQKFSQVGLSPDGKFVNTVSGIRYPEQQYKELADQIFNTPDPKTGRMVSEEVAGRLKSLPTSIQKHYQDKYPEDPVKGFYEETLMPWKKPDQIEKMEPKTNEFALEQAKAKDKSNQLAQKFGYDKILEKMRLAGNKQNAEDVAKFKKDLQNKSKKEQVGALKGMVDTQINAAIGNTPPVYDYETKEPLHPLEVSPATLEMFSYTKGTGSDKETIYPDNLMVSQDGKSIRVTFYKKDTDGNPILKENGEKEVDEQKTKKFSKEEYTVRFGKDVLGVSATEKEINADDDDDEDGSGGTPPPTATKKPKLY